MGLTTLDGLYHQTPWMVSIDVAEPEYCPVADDRALLDIGFESFDDSFLAKKHNRWNEPEWDYLTSAGPARYRGGELNDYTGRDQSLALANHGPHGETFEDAATRFDISFMIANDQPTHQPMSRLKSASLSLGYRMAVTGRQTNGSTTRLSMQNIGIAPPQHSISVSVGSSEPVGLRSLGIGESQTVDVPAGNGGVVLSATRLLSQQRIPHDVVPGGSGR